MPREIQHRSLDGTRWTSTRAMPTLIAPHGGTGGLSGCSCGSKAPGLAGCGCSARPELQFASRQLKGLRGLELVSAGPTQMDILKPNERTLVTLELYLYGQPPLGVQGVLDQVNQILLAQGYGVPTVSAPKAYPLGWSWAWEPVPKAWTAYVTNADAGPFRTELNIANSEFFLTQAAAPEADSTKILPTQGVVLNVDALPSAEVLSPEALTALRAALERIKVPNGTNLRSYVHLRGTPKKGNWFWGLLALGGLAYASSKL